MDLLYEATRIPPADRAAFLDRACGGDKSVKSKVESLLDFSGDDASAPFGDAQLDRQRRQMDAFVEQTANRVESADASGATETWTVEPLPTVLGEYEIVRIIGEGGMGCVYEAIQQYPRRTVALKVIKPGLTSRRMMHRFHREANVLGRLQHPGIAQIYDAGVFNVTRHDGQKVQQPYLAMEYVDGVPLDVFASVDHVTPCRGLPNGLLLPTGFPNRR
jgi:serine/threonine protein kinase